MHTSNDYQLFLKVGNVLWIPSGSFKLNNVQTPQSLKNFYKDIAERRKYSSTCVWIESFLITAETAKVGEGHVNARLVLER
mgnify:CR=1 FL=1